MITVKLAGGLGNQMFQYAYAKALQAKGYEVQIDKSIYKTYILHGGYQLDKYYVDIPVTEEYKNSFVSKLKNKLGISQANVCKENTFAYDSTMLRLKDNTRVEGYFQSEEYFKEIRGVLLDSFRIREKLSEYTRKVESQIENTATSCSLHIRRGDYVSNQKNAIFHGNCNLDYYKKAVDTLNDQYMDIQYFIFSDDIAWVKRNLNIDHVIFVESKEKRIPHEDIYLMSLCHHNIIANSSFSWWGAWLNRNKNKIVIAPDRWFADKDMLQQSKDIVCKGWIKI